MKELILTSLLFSLVTTQNFAIQDCLPCSATLTLDANSLLTDLIPYGIKRQQISSSNNGPSLLGQSTFWMGGVDPSGNFKFAGEIPEKEGSDFYPGPLSRETGLTDSETCANWDQFFLMKREIICDHYRLYQKYVINQGTTIPEDSISIFIKSWPAIGNPYFEEVMGFALPDDGRSLAPYWDAAGLGSYQPIYGSFPIVFGDYDCHPHTIEEAIARVPDEFAFWIFNDVGGFHSNSQTMALNIEVQAMAFANKAEGIINQTINHMYKIINYGKEELRSVHVGLNINPELGCREDDFFGIEPERNLFYSYNKDSFDGTEDCICDDGEQSWCEDIPMHGIKILDKIKSFRQITISPQGDTILIVPENPQSIDTFLDLNLSNLNYYNVCQDPIPDGMSNCIPQSLEEYYELIQGNFSDGTAVTYGGSGYNIGSTDSTSFVFPHAPNSGDWSMCSEPQELNDYRPFISFGPAEHYIGGTLFFSFASFYVEDVSHPCPSLDLLFEADEKLEEYHDNCYSIERDDKLFTSSLNLITPNKEFVLYPNPFINQINLKGQSDLESVSIYDNLGQLVHEASIEELVTKTITTSSLAAGLHFIKVDSESKLYKLIKTE